MRKKPIDDEVAREPLGELFKRNLSETYRDISAIIKAKIEIAKLDIFEALAGILALLIAGTIGFFGFVLLLVSLAFFIGETLGRTSLGFLTVGVILAFASVVLIKFKGEELKELILKKLVMYDLKQPDEDVEEAAKDLKGIVNEKER